MAGSLNRTVRRHFLVLLVLMAGCTSPSNPSAALTALSLSPLDDLLLLRASRTYSAIGTFPDGSTRAAEAKWLVDNPAVATVNASGTVTGVAPGSATIVATAGGQTASRVVRVVPDFSGTWNGSSQITACSAGDP